MKVEISQEYSQLAQFVSSVPQLFQRGEGTVLKDKRNCVRRFEAGGHTLVAKRYKRVNAFQSVAYTFFCPTKAERAFRFAAEMRRRGVATPHEVAYMEQRRWGLFTVGYFISEESHGTEAFPELVKREQFNRPLADAVTDYIVFMHSRGILHGDMNAANFLFEGNAHDGYTLEVIDTNRSHFTPSWPTDEECLHNLVRFTHRRDLYRYVVRRYATQRGWDPDATAERAERLLDKFENRKIRL